MITSSSLPLPLGIQLIFRCIIMEAHGNIEAAAATEHGSESQLIELLSEEAGQTGEYELPLESDAVEPPSKKVKLTLTTSAGAEHASPDRTATEHASPDGTATEHASTSANAKGCASADDTPLETVSPEPDSSSSMGLPFPLHHFGAVVKKHADNYKPEGSPDIYFQGEPFKLKDIRDDYMHQRRSCDQGILFACIKALLIVYHVNKFEHTATITTAQRADKTANQSDSKQSKAQRSKAKHCTAKTRLDKSRAFAIISDSLLLRSSLPAHCDSG